MAVALLARGDPTLGLRPPGVRREPDVVLGPLGRRALAVRQGRQQLGRGLPFHGPIVRNRPDPSS